MAIDRGIETVKHLQSNTFDALNQKNVTTLENLDKIIDVIKTNLTIIGGLGNTADVDTSSCFEEQGSIDNIIEDTKNQITACYNIVSNNLTRASNDSIYRIDITINDVEKLSIATGQCLNAQTSDACLESLQTQLENALDRIPPSILRETVQAAKTILEASIPVDDCTQGAVDSENNKIANILTEITECVYNLLGQ